jgi:hypothetical protein
VRRYLKVPQRAFDASDAESFGELVRELREGQQDLLSEGSEPQKE